MDPWIISLLGYLLFTTWAALYNKKFVNDTRLHPFVSAQVRAVLVGLPVSVLYAHFTGGLYAPSLAVVTVAALEGIVGVAYGYTSFYAVRRSDAGVFATLIKLHIIPVILCSSLLLGESLTGWRIVGAALLLISSMVLGKRAVPKTHMPMIVLSCLLLAVIVLLERYIVVQTDVGMTLLMGTLFGSIYRTPFTWRAIARQRAQIRYELKTMVIASLLSRPQLILFLLATELSGNLALVSALASVKVVLVSLGAAVFLGETDNLRRKLLAAVVATIGVLFL